MACSHRRTHRGGGDAVERERYPVFFDQQRRLQGLPRPRWLRVGSGDAVTGDGDWQFYRRCVEGTFDLGTAGPSDQRTPGHAGLLSPVRTGR